jgi:hypothetical protein
MTKGNRPVSDPEAHGTGFQAVLDDLAARVQVEPALAEIPQERRVLVHHADHLKSLAGPQ